MTNGDGNGYGPIPAPRGGACPPNSPRRAAAGRGPADLIVIPPPPIPSGVSVSRPPGRRKAPARTSRCGPGPGRDGPAARVRHELLPQPGFPDRARERAVPRRPAVGLRRTAPRRRARRRRSRGAGRPAPVMPPDPFDLQGLRGPTCAGGRAGSRARARRKRDLLLPAAEEPAELSSKPRAGVVPAVPGRGGPQGLSDPAPDRPRQALVWLDNAATTQKPRRSSTLARFYEHDNSNIHRGAHTLAARATDLYEGARDKVRRFLGASQSRGDRLRPRRHRGHQPRGPDLWPEEHRQGRRDRPDPPRAPRQHRPLATAGPGKGAVLRVVPVNDKGEVLLEEYEKLLGPRTKLVALTHVSNALGRCCRSADDPAGAPPRRPGADRRRPVGAAHADRRAGAGLRLLRLLRPQAVRADRHRRALRQAGVAGGHAALARRRQHDRPRSPSSRRPTTACPASSRPAPATSPAPLAWAPPSTTSTTSAWTTSHRYEQELLDYGTEALSRVPGLCAHRHRRREGQRPVLRPGRACVPRTWAATSTGRGSRSAPGHHCAQPIAAALRRRRHRPPVAGVLQHPRRHRRPGDGGP